MRRLSVPHNTALAASCGLLALILLTLFGLAGRRARWQGDEYLFFAQMHQLGWPFYISWYFGWSPRLWSNIGLILYAFAVNHLHRPLAGTCAGVLMIGLFACTMLPAWFCARSITVRLQRLLLGLALCCLFLLGHGISEVFMWPEGAISYVPTLAGVVLLFWRLNDGVRTRGEAGIAAASLCLVAGCSEVGAFFAVAFSVLTAVAFWRRLRNQWWLLPGCGLAMLDLALVLHGRVGTIENTSRPHPFLHLVGPSLFAGFKDFAWSAVSLDGGEVGWRAALWGLIPKCLVLYGALLCPVAHSYGSRRYLLAFGAGLLVASYITVASALYQFGTLCCERHETMRQCFYFVAIAAFGAAWGAGSRRAQHGYTFAALMVGAVMLLFVPETSMIVVEYRLFPATETARAATWRSGLATGSNSFTFVLPTAGPLIGGNGFAPGIYTENVHTPWHLSAAMNYFGKTDMTVKRAP